MESQCDYSMYFPAVPLPRRELLAGEAGGGYRALPRRNHLYLGETVRFLLVLRKIPGNPERNPEKSPGKGPAGKSPWLQLASSLSALATVTAGDGAARARDGDEPRERPGEEEEDDEEGPREPPLFRECRALLTHARGPAGGAGNGLPVDDPIVSSDEVIFPLTVSLDRLPPGTAKAKIVVTVWQRDTEPPELARARGVPAAAPGPRPRPGVPAAARRLQGTSVHAADGAAAPPCPLPPGDRVRQIPDRAQSSQWQLPGRAVPVGRADPAQFQRQLPARDARRLRAAGGRRLPPLRGGARGRLLPRPRPSLGVAVSPPRPGGAELPVPAAGARAAAPRRQGGPGGAPGGRGQVVDAEAALHQQHRHPLQAAEHPSGAAAVRDDGHLRVPGGGPAALHRHLHPPQRAAGLPGRAPGLDPRGHRRAVAGLGGLGGLSLPPDQPGLLPQGQRQDLPRGLPGPPRRALRAVPAHEAEAAVHGQRGQRPARGAPALPQEQPQLPGRARAGGRPGPLPVLLPPAAGPQPPHEVGQRDGAPRHHAPRGLPRGPPAVPARGGQGRAGPGQDRQEGVQGARGATRAVTPGTAGTAGTAGTPGTAWDSGDTGDSLGQRGQRGQRGQQGQRGQRGQRGHRGQRGDSVGQREQPGTLLEPWGHIVGTTLGPWGQCGDSEGTMLGPWGQYGDSGDSAGAAGTSWGHPGDNVGTMGTAWGQ